MKFLPLLAATALILPTVAVAQSTPDDQAAAPAKSKHGKKHKDTLPAPDSSAAPADTTATPPAASDPSSAPSAPSASPPSSASPSSADSSAAPTPPRF